MASRNNRSGGSEPTWRHVLFYVWRLVLVYQPSRRAVESATMDYRFRGHGSLAKSRSGSDGDGVLPPHIFGEASPSASGSISSGGLLPH